jgi:phosphoribosylamine--glycine ligase
MGGMRILVLGSGAREHAIIRALASEQAGHEVTAAPGNAGIAAEAFTVGLDANDPAAVADYAERHAIELVVVGPEAPLVAGVADAVRDRGIPVFGPSKAAAQLEGSKTFAKGIMETAGVPTGRADAATTLAEAEAALDRFGAPFVVKANGLAAGKGVLVTADRDAALAHAAEYLQRGTVLIEEFLDGPEVSLFLLSDGEHVLPLSPAQDYKRLLDGDEGPNTGGMGAYSPVPWLDENFVDEVIDTVALPTITTMAAEGTPFVGLLYCGLVVTDAGVRVIEFNARFGDPETQVVLPRLLTPLSGLLLAAATRRLGGLPRPEFAFDVAVGVVLASEGYPAAPVTGRRLSGVDAADAEPEVQVFHAATAVQTIEEDATASWSTDVLVATGGRVLTVTALGTTFGEARDRAYAALSEITLEGGQHRGDIAARVAAAAH